MSKTTKGPVEFTDLAREKVLGFLESDSDTRHAVRIHVASPSPLDPRYDITLIEHHEKCERRRRVRRPRVRGCDGPREREDP